MQWVSCPNLQTTPDWSRKLRRAQRYLGLRAVRNADQGSDSELRENAHQSSSPRLSAAGSEAAIDLAAAAPHPFDSDVVLLSVDVEVYERSHKQLTEIGIAVLDTRQLVDISPGEGGKNWMEKVQGRHLWIREYMHLTNKDFVTGCPDRYEECFGTSEVVSTRDAVKILENCFEDPTLAAKGGKTRLPSSDDEGKPAKQPETAKQAPGTSSGDGEASAASVNPRKIVVIGHDITQDLSHLKGINFDLLANNNVLEVLDTSELYRTMRHEEKAPSVSTMLYNFDISGWNLHNAGNDAGYTLQAFVGIAVRSMTQKIENHADTTTMIENAKKEAENRIRDNLEEWELASEGEDADGGSPNDPTTLVMPQK
jgi:hypothetical protein